ncbi:MAG: SAM-dependent methyltransferase [Verrucomicrobiota bacterium]
MSLEKTGHESVEAMIAEKIKLEGDIAFEDFMSISLYTKGLGYYLNKKKKTGKSGDFYTSVSVGSAFGSLLAEFFRRFKEHMANPKPFLMVEQGANDGELANDILRYFQQVGELSEVEYWIVEPSSSLQHHQKEQLQKYGFVDQVKWYSCFEEIEDNSIQGVFFSNELVDSFPVKLVVYRHGQWMEKRVTRVDGSFKFKETTLRDLSTLEYIKRWKLPAIEGYQGEVCLGVRRWVKQVASKIKEGLFLTIDYGSKAESLYAPGRGHGTIRAYRNHQQKDELLSYAGEQDLTAHVNFSQIIEEGKASGLEFQDYRDQHQALITMAKHRLLKMETSGGPIDQKFLRQFKTLTHPEIMGSQFKFLSMVK